MNNMRQVVIGALAALLSTLLILGGLFLSMDEGQGKIAQAVTHTPSQSPTLAPTSTPLPLVPTARPGEPTFTPSPTPLPSATPTVPPPPTDCPPPPGWSVITVQTGDTLESLAKVYQTTPQELARANCLVTSTLRSQSLLYVPPVVSPSSTPPASPTSPAPVGVCPHPPGWVVYIVESGDTLYHLSNLLNVSVYDLQVANCMIGRSDLIAGQGLYVPRLPAPNPTATPQPSRTPTRTPMPTPTRTSPPIPTDTGTPPPAPTPTPTLTSPPVPSATSTSTATLPPIPTHSPTPTATLPPPPTATDTPVPPDTATPTLTPGP